MSTFKVTVETIKEILEHDNADSLEIGRLESMSYQFVVKKGTYKPGDTVVYFPLDAVIPEALQEVLGVAGYLSKNRVRTVKLRGKISQGLVCPLKVIVDYLGAGEEPEDLTTALGVTKYEPPPVMTKSAHLMGLPSDMSKYDIENADRYPKVLELLKVRAVEVSEKLEGQNVWFRINNEKGGTSDLIIGQRQHRIQPIEGETHFLDAYATHAGIMELLKEIVFKLNAQQSVILYGEAIGPGIQGNYYDLKEKEVRFFDIKMDGHWVPKGEFRRLVPEEQRVPLLYFDGPLCDFLGEETIQEVSNGSSALNSKKRREGIVVTPLEEGDHEDIGRLFLKQHSPEYLAKSKL